MLKLGVLCCLVAFCLAKEKRVLLVGNTGTSGTGLTGGSTGLTGGLTGGSSLFGGGSGGFLLGGYADLLQKTTQYWTNLMTALIGGGGSSSGGSGGLTGGSLPGLSGGLPGLSLPGLDGGASGSTGTLPSTTTSLGRYNIDKSQISVSGLSAGAAFATQMHVIYSSTIMGAGIIAGLPFYCTNGAGVMAALTTCMQSASEDLSSIESKVSQGAQSGQIDPTSNMGNDKVYVFAGTADSTVNPANGPKIASFYEHYLSQSNIKSVFNMAAAHGQPTDNFGTACSVSNQQNFINNCGYSAAYDLLNWIYGGSLQKPSQGYKTTGEIIAFSQTEFISSPASNGMDEVGYLYVPAACKDGANACKLHVAFHGCKQGRKRIGDAYIGHAGYNEVADLNNIIILYPQAQPSMMNGNPNGCFDWWGYAGNNFDLQNEKSMREVLANRLDDVIKHFEKTTDGAQEHERVDVKEGQKELLRGTEFCTDDKLTRILKGLQDEKKLRQSQLAAVNFRLLEFEQKMEDTRDDMDFIKQNFTILKDTLDTFKTVLVTDARDCKDIQAKGKSTSSGVYDVSVDVDGELQVLQVYCDMNTDGGGWTKRYDGSVDFFQNFKEYEEGFGRLEGEFWLGDRLGKNKWHDGMAFTTKDRDQDTDLGGNCAVSRHGGYWYFGCTTSNLNGKYKTAEGDRLNTGFYWKYTYPGLSASEMKFRKTKN